MANRAGLGGLMGVTRAAYTAHAPLLIEGTLSSRVPLEAVMQSTDADARRGKAESDGRNAIRPGISTFTPGRCSTG